MESGKIAPEEMENAGDGEENPFHAESILIGASNIAAAAVAEASRAQEAQAHDEKADKRGHKKEARDRWNQLVNWSHEHPGATIRDAFLSRPDLFRCKDSRSRFPTACADATYTYGCSHGLRCDKHFARHSKTCPEATGGGLEPLTRLSDFVSRRSEMARYKSKVQASDPSVQGFTGRLHVRTSFTEEPIRFLAPRNGQASTVAAAKWTKEAATSYFMMLPPPSPENVSPVLESMNKHWPIVDAEALREHWKGVELLKAQAALRPAMVPPPKCHIAQRSGNRANSHSVTSLGMGLAPPSPRLQMQAGSIRAGALRPLTSQDPLQSIVHAATSRLSEVEQLATSAYRPPEKGASGMPQARVLPPVYAKDSDSQTNKDTELVKQLTDSGAARLSPGSRPIPSPASIQGLQQLLQLTAATVGKPLSSEQQSESDGEEGHSGESGEEEGLEGSRKRSASGDSGNEPSARRVRTRK